MTILQLIYVFFYFVLLGCGGGYALLSMVRFDGVVQFAWLTCQQVSDIIAL